MKQILVLLCFACSVAFAQTAQPLTALANDVISTTNLSVAGDATPGSFSGVTTNERGGVTIQVSGTWTGSLVPQVSNDSVNWITRSDKSMYDVSTGNLASTIPSGATGIWQLPAYGTQRFRLIAAGPMTGSATVTIRTSPSSGSISINNFKAGSLPTPDDYGTGTMTTNAAGAATQLGPMNGISFALLNVSAISGGATVNVQGSLDGNLWTTLAIANVGNGPNTTPLAAAGVYGVSGASGFPYLRAIQNTAGSVTFNLRATAGSGTKFVWSLLPDGFQTKGYGVATAASPAYVEGKTSPLSMGLGGALRVDGSSVVQPVSGSVTVSNFPSSSGTVSVSNFPSTQPVSIAATVPVSGTVSVANFPAAPATQAVTGTVAVSNLPTTQAVSGSVSVGNFPSTQPVSGTVSVANFPAQPASQAVTGTVAVSNLPATQAVSGSVSVSNLPATQPVSGTVAISGTVPVSLATAPTTPVTGTFWPSVQPISGAVSVSNLPTTQPVSGSVAVSNFPTTQAVTLASAPTTPVTGTFWQTTQPVSVASVPLPTGASTEATLAAVNTKLGGTLAVSGTFFQATQPVSLAGTLPVSIATMPSTPVTGAFFQATQPVIGTVGVSNFPATQAVTLAVAPTTPVTGTFWQATQPVTVTSMPAETTTITNGQTAHSAPSTGNPVRVAGRVNTAVDSTLIAGDVSDLFMTSSGALVVKPYSVPELDWQATSGLTPLTVTTASTVKAAGAAGVRNYVTACQFTNAAGINTSLVLLDGTKAIWSTNMPAASVGIPYVPFFLTFPTPLRGSSATALNIQLGTVAASVSWNCQGYQAP